MQCEHCGYSLEGLTPDAGRYLCPECGKRAVGRMPEPFRSVRFLATRVVPTLLAGPLLYWVLVAQVWSLGQGEFAELFAELSVPIAAAYLGWAFLGPLTVLGSYCRGRIGGHGAVRLLALAWAGNAACVGLCVMGIIAVARGWIP